MPRAPKRRVYGSGSVYEVTDAKGRHWYRGIVELGQDEHGVRKRKTITRKTRTAVVRLIEEARRDLDAGTLPKPGDPTLATWLDEWLQGREGVKLSTIERYGQIIKRLPPKLRNLPLVRVEPSNLERCYRQLRAEGMAPAGVLKVHLVLHAALERAKRRGLVRENVTTLVDAPRAPKIEVKTISSAKSVAILRAARGDRLEALYALAVTVGMRIGELLALRWEDVDWEGSAVMVRGSVRKGVRSNETKTNRHRRISVGPLALELLRTHRIRQAEERLAAGPKWQDNDLLFPAFDGRPLGRDNFTHRSWYPLRERAGLLGVLFKDATRHGASTRLLAAGIQTRIVADILGHAQASTTSDIYEHVLPGMQDPAVVVMEALLREARETG